MPQKPKVRFGDGTPCRHPASILEDLGTLVVFAGQAGRGFGDDQALRRRELEAEEKAASIRADLQRIQREGSAAMATAAQPSAWPEVRQHARRAGDELKVVIERWQEQATTACERTRRNLVQYQRDIAASMQADLFAYLRHCLIATQSSATLVRRLGPERYLDTLRFEAVPGLRAELVIDPRHCSAPQRVRVLGRGFTIQAGIHKGLFGREKPRTLKLDRYVIAEAVLSPTAIDLRLAPRLESPQDVLLLRLRPEQVAGVQRIRGRLTLGETRQEPVVGDEVLQRLWDALQKERLAGVARPSVVEAAELDGEAITEPRQTYDAAIRLIDAWRPVVTEIVKHTPGADELCVLVANETGPDDELWVRKADLTQHLLTIPARMRERLSPLELLGPAQVTRESDIIDLGRVLTPDAGEDSDVIALHYIPPASERAAIEAGAPTRVLELQSTDISVVELGRDPQEKSGCYDLSKLGRSAQSG